MAVAWPKVIEHDDTPRSQFHHVIDIAPTIYEVAKITPPQVVNGFIQDFNRWDQLVYTFADPNAEGRRHTQFFDIWPAAAFIMTAGLPVRWVSENSGCKECHPVQDNGRPTRYMAAL